MKRFFEQDRRQSRAEVDLPSGRGFIALLEAFRSTGGTAPGEIVGRLSEKHQIDQAVRQDGHSPADRLDPDLDAVVLAAQVLDSAGEVPALLAPRAHEIAAHV